MVGWLYKDETMGIKVEYNPDLALRNFSHFKAGERKQEECIPENLVAGEEYEFLKKGQRLFWLEGELPFLETEGNEKLSLPVASIIILESVHFMENGEVWTRGRYKIVEVFEDDVPRFNGFAKM